MSNERIQVGGEAAWVKIQLPDRYLYNNGRNEFKLVMDWLRNNVGAQGQDWNYGILANYITFKKSSDVLAFKIRFGL